MRRFGNVEPDLFQDPAKNNTHGSGIIDYYCPHRLPPRVKVEIERRDVAFARLVLQQIAVSPSFGDTHFSQTSNCFPKLFSQAGIRRACIYIESIGIR